MTVTTIVYNRVVAARSLDIGVVVDDTNSNAPRPALLDGYKAAEWTSFAFGIAGWSYCSPLKHRDPHIFSDGRRGTLLLECRNRR